MRIELEATGRVENEDAVTDEALARQNARLKAALRRIRNGLHAHNRPDVPLPNDTRIRLRDIADLALEEEGDEK